MINLTFMENFLSATHSITRADRGLAVDANLNVLARIKVDEALLDDPIFNRCAMTTLQEVINTGKSLITNNMIIDPADAPNTNTNLANLRFVVGIPVGSSAIYLDQRIRTGILISREIVDNLVRLANYLQEHNLENSTVEEICGYYESLN